MVNLYGCVKFTISRYFRNYQKIPLLTTKATPSGILVSGPVDFEERMWTGTFHHYLIVVISIEY